MADNMGVAQPRFIDLHKSALTDIKMKLLDYVLSLEHSVHPDSRNPGNRVLDPRPDLKTTIGEGGFPIVPQVTEDMTKLDLERLLAWYLNVHYRESACIHTPLPRRRGAMPWQPVSHPFRRTRLWILKGSRSI